MTRHLPRTIVGAGAGSATSSSACAFAFSAAATAAFASSRTRRSAPSSFCFFASGAIIPILPYVFGLTGYPAILLAAGLVGLALLFTGGVVGVPGGVSVGGLPGGGFSTTGVPSESILIPGEDSGIVGAGADSAFGCTQNC